MNTSVFKGSATAIITPMNMDGSISYKKMEELLEYQISHHTNAIVVAGTTGESACLSDEEHLRLIQFTCRNDDQAVSALALGAKGVISVLSNIEALLESLTSDINPVPVKTAMNMMGLSVGPCRLPLCPMDDFAAQQLKNCLKLYHLLSE